MSVAYKSCPRCGMQITLPDVNGAGSDRGGQYRSCSCTVDRTIIPSAPGDISELYRKICKLEDWMDIMIHLIPNGPPLSTPGYLGVDLNGMKYDKNPPVPHPVLLETMKRNAYIVEQYRREQPKENLHFAVCLYCGAMNFRYIQAADGFGAPATIVDEYQTCFDCNEMKAKHPAVFGWVTKILLLAFRTLGEQRSPRESITLFQRNILVDDAPEHPKPA